MYVIYIHTKFHILRLSGTLSITTKWKAKYLFRALVMSLHVLQKYTQNESYISLFRR